MGPPLALSLPWLPPKTPFCNSSSARHQFDPFSSSRASTRRCQSRLSFVERKVESSWVPDGGRASGEFGGWLVEESEINGRNRTKNVLFVGVGASVAILLAGFTCYLFSRRGFKYFFAAPFHAVHATFTTSDSTSDPNKDAEIREPEANQLYEENLEKNVNTVPNEPKESPCSGQWAPGRRNGVVATIPADPSQEAAVSVLKKLQIIENDVSASELCTRRDFARWFVKASSKLERKRNRKIVPDILLAGSVVRAFDDVNTADPDFWCIQSLAEAGIVLSKLSPLETGSSDIGISYLHGNSYFLPESYLSRFDLVNWKALAEYTCNSELLEEMKNKKVDFLDLSACPDVSAQLLIDLMAGERSIFRRVFGNTRCLQPYKPVTIAQAAVALTSGRMEEAIRSELTKLEAENISRLDEVEEIRQDLIRRGQIPSFWEEKLKKEQEHEFEVKKDLQVALLELEEEKTTREESLVGYIKDKASVDCQQELLSSLMVDVSGMCISLAGERSKLVTEQQKLEKMCFDFSSKHELTVEAKSTLEAEKEALRMLRSWVEGEAMRIRARAKILEQAVRRWRCPDEV